MTTSRILIIDDDPAVLTALPDLFRLWMPGVVLDVCGSGRLALDHVEQTDYDAIISDIRLPDLDGMMLMERIKAIRPHTPILLVTGYGDQTLAMQALRGGAFDYILKPIERDYLLSSVQRAMHLRQLSRQAEEHQQTEQVLRESQASLHAIIETMPCLLVVIDGQGRLLFFNRRAEERTGYSRQEVLGKAVHDLFIPEAWKDQALQQLTHHHDHTTSTHQLPWRTKRGDEVVIEWRVTSIPWPQQPDGCRLAIGIDMTDRQSTAKRIDDLNTELDRQVHEYAKVVRDLETSKAELQEKIVDLETFQEVVVGRELKMITLEKQVSKLQEELQTLRTQQATH